MADKHVPVDIVRTQKNREITFDLRAYDETIDTEVYESSPDAFSLKQLGMETFEPAVPLLKSALKTGDKWDWAGTITGGPVHRAEGTITTLGDILKEPGGTSEPAVKCQVEFRLDNETKTPAKRSFTFWFVKGKGILKREAVSGSTRQLPEPQ